MKFKIYILKKLLTQILLYEANMISFLLSSEYYLLYFTSYENLRFVIKSYRTFRFIFPKPNEFKSILIHKLFIHLTTHVFILKHYFKFYFHYCFLLLKFNFFLQVLKFNNFLQPTISATKLFVHLN